MRIILDFISMVLSGTWGLFLDASPYILFGILVAGLLRMFLSPDDIARHLGRGRIRTVIKASLLGIPLPLCSCGVLPAAVSLRKQGAGRGAVMAFLISTPETGIDSIAISWALLDPVMTVARPVAAFVTATVAGIAQNILGGPDESPEAGKVDRVCAVDGCCDGADCSSSDHAGHHSLGEKLLGGVRYAFGDLWGDIAGWFAVGMVLAGIITALVPEESITAVLGGGIGSLLLMLFLGVPLYICATASTPIAAALILKGVSPGAALVFLLVGPATNIAGITVLTGLLGRRSVAVYLGSIAAVSLLAGLVLDWIYLLSGIRAEVVAGKAADLIPLPVQVVSAALLLGISVRPIYRSAAGFFQRTCGARGKPPSDACGCGG